MSRAVCFVLMPFGRKPDEQGRIIDFDAVYRDVIAPAVEAAGLLCIRADEEQGLGVIHRLMFERLLLSEYAIADLTLLNTNVYYELGIRHAMRPQTTVLTMAELTRLPFDVANLRALPYALNSDGVPTDASGARAGLLNRLQAVKTRRDIDSPVYQFVDGLTPPPIDHERTDVFREQVAYSASVKAALAGARALKGVNAIAAIDAVREGLGGLDAVEHGVAVDLLLSYRAVSAHQSMVDLVPRLDPALQRTIMVREQLGFALNRLKRSAEAEQLLSELIKERGASSETNGLLGRVYKDRYDQAMQAGEKRAAAGHLRRAIDAYLQGFEADPRDAYPGINAVTLMEIAEPPDPRRLELLPVVTYAVKRRLKGKRAPDYWDHATLLEIAALSSDVNAMEEALGNALTLVREAWEAETTVNNLQKIAEARERRGAPDKDILEIIDDLQKCVAQKKGLATLAS